MLSLVIPAPAINPIAFEIPSFGVFDHIIGPFPIRWYALGYIFGIIIAWNILIYLSKKPKLWGRETAPFKSENIDDLIFWAIFGILFGGRIGYVFFYAPEMLVTPLSILKTWEGGMSFHGGIIGVILATIYISWSKKLDLRHLADAVAISAPLGIGLVRITNFINQELWGRPTEVAWAFLFKTDPLGLPRHPSQLYEAAFEGFLTFAILYFAVFHFRSLYKKGLTAGLFLCLYAISRIILENFREPDAELIFGLTRGMFYSIPMLILGITFLAFAQKANKASN
jgi:phosphatidylglycerol---prolipoprotein diacylglyceryl transferase